MILETLLSAAISTGLGLLAKVGFEDEIVDLKNRLSKKDEKKREAAFNQAYQQARKDAKDDHIVELLDHKPFQEEVVKGLLDPAGGFDFQAVARHWMEKYPESAPALRKFFIALQHYLTLDDTWGPILERYQALRARPETTQALLERRLPTSDRQLVPVVNAILQGSGAVALGEGAQAAFIQGDYYQVGQIIIQEITFGSQESPPASDLWSVYLKELSVQANLLPWANLTTEYAHPDRGESLRLADIYTDLDTNELRHVEREEDLRQLLACPQEIERISAQEMLDREGHLLIMGDPGSGKSTFLKHVTYLFAQAGLATEPSVWLERLSPWDKGVVTPVWLELRHLAAWVNEVKVHPEVAALFQYIESMLEKNSQAELWPLMKKSLRDEKTTLLMLLDGLDEVPTEQRQRVVDIVKDCCLRYPWHRYVVTCRPYAYIGQPWQLQGFHEVTLAPFSSEQIEHFVENWYQQLAARGRFTSQEADSRAALLKAAVQRQDLVGLAERPMLLTVMAQLHSFRSKLPEDRTQLYADTVQLLLQRWDARFGGEEGLLTKLDIPGLKMSDLEAGLYEVAYRAHEGCATSEGTADIDEADLRKWLAPYLGRDWNKAGDFVEYIRERAGLLIRHKTEAYTFPHRTFQEFLAACYLVGMPDYPGEAARLVSTDADRWRDVFVLAAGHAARTHRLSQAVSAVNALLPHDLDQVAKPLQPDWTAANLSGESLLEIGLVGVEREQAGVRLLGRTREWLAAAVIRDKELEAHQRARAGDTLGLLSDPRFDPDHWHLPAEPLLGFVHIPAGKFRMGSHPRRDKEAYDDEKPQHEFDLPDYYIARYPVTVAQFRVFVEASGFDPHDRRSFEGLPNHPVVLIDWHEALAYCCWLGEQMRSLAHEMVASGLEGTYAPQQDFWQGLAQGRLAVALPSEAEWEKAARGDSGWIYPWGDEFDAEKANTDETGLGSKSAVACFPSGASLYGVLDLSGNVWEWTRSLYREYPFSPDNELDELSISDIRVLRGGSFIHYRRYARCACRRNHYPRSRGFNYGFRVVVSPSNSGL